MLLQAVEGELGLVVDEDFKRLRQSRSDEASHGCSQTYVAHEFLARNPDVLGEGGAEHHHLLVVGRDAENFLNIAAHV